MLCNSRLERYLGKEGKMSDYIESVCRKLRLTVQEYGQKEVDGAVIIGSEYDGDQIGGHKYINFPTIADVKLGNVKYSVARFFEDA